MQQPPNVHQMSNHPASGPHPQQQMHLAQHHPQHTSQQHPSHSQLPPPTAQMMAGAAASIAATGKDMPSMIFVCRFGQESVQDIVNKASELFSVLKTISLPNGLPGGQTEDRKNKVQELLRSIGGLFKRLHKIYDRVNDQCAGFEAKPIEELIPFERSDGQSRKESRLNDYRGDGAFGWERGEEGGEEEEKEEENIKPKVTNEAGRMLKAQYDEQVAILRAKNRSLKQTIDSMRELVWDISTMMAMRK